MQEGFTWQTKSVKCDKIFLSMVPKILKESYPAFVGLIYIIRNQLSLLVFKECRELNDISTT